MSSRTHLGLRLSGLLLLLAVTAWPRSRGDHRDRAALGVATQAHFAVTTAARRDVDEPARSRAERSATDDEAGPLDDDGPVVGPTLTN
jgi:hypothetical protein